jgi:hypothetical protein
MKTYNASNGNGRDMYVDPREVVEIQEDDQVVDKDDDLNPYYDEKTTGEGFCHGRYPKSKIFSEAKNTAFVMRSCFTCTTVPSAGAWARRGCPWKTGALWRIPGFFGRISLLISNFRFKNAKFRGDVHG